MAGQRKRRKAKKATPERLKALVAAVVHDAEKLNLRIRELKTAANAATYRIL